MKKNILGLLLLLLIMQGCAQDKNYNQCTIISLGGTEALIFKGELRIKEQVRYIHINDEEIIERIKRKIAVNTAPLWLISKAAESTIYISSYYKDELKKILNPVEKSTVEPLNEKEEEILMLFKKDYLNGF